MMDPWNEQNFIKRGLHQKNRNIPRWKSIVSQDDMIIIYLILKWKLQRIIILPRWTCSTIWFNYNFALVWFIIAFVAAPAGKRMDEEKGSSECDCSEVAAPPGRMGIRRRGWSRSDTAYAACLHSHSNRQLEHFSCPRHRNISRHCSKLATNEIIWSHFPDFGLNFCRKIGETDKFGIRVEWTTAQSFRKVQ